MACEGAKGKSELVYYRVFESSFVAEHRGVVNSNPNGGFYLSRDDATSTAHAVLQNLGRN